MKIRILITFLFLTTVAFTQNKWLDHISFELGYRKLINDIYNPGYANLFNKHNFDKVDLVENTYGAQDYYYFSTLKGKVPNSEIILNNEKTREIFFETLFQNERWCVPVFLSVENYSVNIGASTYVGSNYTWSNHPSKVEYLYFNRKVDYQLSTIIGTFRLGVGYNLIDPSKQFKIIPIFKMGLCKMGQVKSDLNEVTTSYHHSVPTGIAIPSVYFDSTVVTHDADKFIELNKKYRSITCVTGIQFSYLYQNKVGLNLELGYQFRGNTRISYSTQNYFKFGMYASLGVVYQIVLKGK
jgi:hypothetical protein